MSFFEIKKLPYQRDVSHWFAPFANTDGAIWLDSAQHDRGRFDVFTADPILTLLQIENCFSVTGSAATAQIKQTVSDSNALVANTDSPTAAQLFHLMAQLRLSLYGAKQANLMHSHSLTAEQQQWLPGAMGLISYSAGSVDLRLKARPDSASWPQAYLSFYAWLVVVDHHEQTAWLTNYRPLISYCRHTPETITAKIYDAINTQRERTPPARVAADEQQAPRITLNDTSPDHETPDPDYTAQFEQVKAYLAAGDCYQINLARQFQLPVRAVAFELYQQIRKQTVAPYSGFLKTHAGECLCFSPEQFLTITPPGELRTAPIKGTRPRSSDAQADQTIAQNLAESAKDRAENLMIVDLLRNDFGRICQAHSIHVPQLMQVQSFATVHHLVSEVRGLLRDDMSAEDTLAACFPGGSITGAPKKRAMQIIDELETHDRHAFCGSLCHLGANGTLNANICIRTGLLQNDTFTLWAGGGIVIDSALETEWIETLWKVQKILEACLNQDGNYA